MPNLQVSYFKSLYEERFVAATISVATATVTVGHVLRLRSNQITIDSTVRRRQWFDQ